MNNTNQREQSENRWLSTFRTTKLYDMHDSCFLTGSFLHDLMKRHGDDTNPRVLINEWNCWNTTVQDFLAMVEKSNKQTTA